MKNFVKVSSFTRVLSSSTVFFLGLIILNSTAHAIDYCHEIPAGSSNIKDVSGETYFKPGLDLMIECFESPECFLRFSANRAIDDAEAACAEIKGSSRCLYVDSLKYQRETYVSASVKIQCQL
ncbi:MAG: hypothetical protein SGJ18_03445 [Pseudomonadota bacterium]|nr:hypothetical protein [Pseudomonadota bacterium]